MDDALLRSIGLHCPNLVKLHIHFDPEPFGSDSTAASFEYMIKGLPALEDILVEDYNMPNTILPLLGLYCPRLKYGQIDNIACTDDGFVSMCQGCPLLESLTLRHLNDISDISLLAVATYCPMLKELSISYVDCFTIDSLCTLFASCTLLTSVTLIDLPHITDKAILTLLKCCTQLTTLSLCDTPRLTDYCIQAIPTYFPRIQSLELRHIRTISHETIVQISRHCKQMSTLLLQGCINLNNYTVVAVLENGKNLSKVKIDSSNIRVCDEFKNKCDALTANRRYRTLSLTYSNTSVYTS